jgi:hypothetical protein
MSSFMMVRHKVKDFNAWKAGYDAHQPVRQAAGLTEKHLLRSEDDPNEVVMMFEARDVAGAKAFASSDDLRDKMKEVGVIDRPDIYFLNG